jgi:hypothetical protein
MNQRVADMIDMLQAVDWFHAVGQPVGLSVERAMSWAEANQNCATDQWNDTLLEARNHMTRSLNRDFPDAFLAWSDVINEAKEVVDSLIQSKIEAVMGEQKLTKSGRSTVIWSIWNMVLSAHYGDLYIPTFYADLACWYVKGHFPCGWKGEYPEGRLIVY